MADPDYLMLSVEADTLSRNLICAHCSKDDDRVEYAIRALEALSRAAGMMGASVTVSPFYVSRYVKSSEVLE